MRTLNTPAPAVNVVAVEGRGEPLRQRTADLLSTARDTLSAAARHVGCGGPGCSSDDRGGGCAGGARGAYHPRGAGDGAEDGDRSAGRVWGEPAGHQQPGGSCRGAGARGVAGLGAPPESADAHRRHNVDHPDLHPEQPNRRRCDDRCRRVIGAGDSEYRRCSQRRQRGHHRCAGFCAGECGHSTNGHPVTQRRGRPRRPITITTGGTYTGWFQSNNSAVPAVTISTTQPVTLSRARIIAKGHGVKSAISGTQLTIRDSVFEQTDPGAVVEHRAVELYRPASFVFEYNNLIDTDGVWLNGGTGSPHQMSQVRVNNNLSINIGRYPRPTAGGCCVQFIQLSNISKLPQGRSSGITHGTCRASRLLRTTSAYICRAALIRRIVSR